MHNEIKRQQFFRSLVWVSSVILLIAIWTMRYWPSFSIGTSQNRAAVNDGTGWSESLSISSPEDLLKLDPQAENTSLDLHLNEPANLFITDDVIAFGVMEKLQAFRRHKQLAPFLGAQWLTDLTQQNVPMLLSMGAQIRKGESLPQLEASLANGTHYVEGIIQFDYAWLANVDDMTAEKIATNLADYWLNRSVINGLSRAELNHASIAIKSEGTTRVALLVLFKPQLYYQNPIPLGGEGIVKMKLAPNVAFEQVRLTEQTGDCSYFLAIPELPEQTVKLRESGPEELEFIIPPPRHSFWNRWFECDWRRLRFYVDSKPINWGRVVFEQAVEAAP